MSLLPNPRATIVRNVLLFPADGTEPRIIPKTFSEAASKANPVSFYTTSVDLRSHYGKQMATTFVQFLTSHPNPITLECNEGEFLCYYNVSPELPINQSAGRIIGIDPIAFESKVFWRGDIIVVKAEEWPGPTVMGGGFHQLYHDVDPSFQATAESLLRNLYESNHLKQEIESRVISERESVHSGTCFLCFP
jgi:hypothetical protein